MQGDRFLAAILSRSGLELLESVRFVLVSARVVPAVFSALSLPLSLF